MKLHKLWLILILALIYILPLHAQDTSNWTSILYLEAPNNATYDAELLILSPNNPRSIDLPSNLAATGWTMTYDASASDDGRFVVLHQFLEGQRRSVSARIYDTETGGCCVDLADNFDTVEAFSFGGFEPNGHRFAFSYVKTNLSAETLFSGGIMVIDLAKGVILADLAMSDVNAAIGGNNFGVWASMGGWDGNRILFAPNCYACGGVFEGTYAAYDLSSATYTADTGIPFSAFGTRLDGTGELLYLTQDTRFSYNPSEGMFPTPNVVQYNPTQFGQSPNGTVIYASSDATSLAEVHWVDNGAAALVSPLNTNFWELVFRASRTPTRLFYEADERFLMGLPSGFMTTLPQSDRSLAIRHWENNGSIREIARSAANRTVLVANRPRLGENLTTVAAFIEVQPTNSVIVQCPFFLPSRLQVGQSARVTPGEANRIREYAGIEAPQLGQIAGGEIFEVLQGPVCDEQNQIAWWRVRFNGIEGWTAEGRADEYWTEPLR